MPTQPITLNFNFIWQVAEWLLAKGDPVNGAPLDTWPRPRVGDCPVPLIVACANRDVEMVRLLLEHHADVNLTRNNVWATPLKATFLELDRNPDKTASAVKIGRLLVDRKPSMSTILLIIAKDCPRLEDPQDIEVTIQ